MDLIKFNFYKVVRIMTNLEKLKTGTDDEIKKLCIQLAYRANNYTYQALQVSEWLQKECKTNEYGEIII